MKWKDKKQVKNWEVIFMMIISMLAGFTWAYLYWGKGIPFF